MTPKPPALAPGTYERVAADGHTRYTLVVPPDVGTAPMVLGLHYAGHGAPHYATGFVSALGLEKLGALVVAPDCATGRGWANPASQEVVLSLLDEVKAELGATPPRTAIIGYSMGGIGAWYLAAYAPGKFDAIIPVAAQPPGPLTEWNTPVYAIHGTEDELFDAAPTRAAVAGLDPALDARMVEVQGLGHYDVSRYQPALLQAWAWFAKGASDGT